MTEDQRIENLLDDFEFINPEFGKIIRSLRNKILEIALQSEEKIMYGGILYERPGQLFCGLFLRKNHISVEFGQGHLLIDKENHLEGSGKFRRHLKIHNKSEIKTKRFENFVKEAYNLKI